jgi:hypothetical protein
MYVQNLVEFDHSGHVLNEALLRILQSVDVNLHSSAVCCCLRRGPAMDRQLIQGVVANDFQN